jgi:hypothetical protein
MNTRRSPPSQCPVCGERLMLTSLGCESCGTEISGTFEPCEFCSLNAEDRAMLKVFLKSRGNLKEVQRHLGVSYPTARARFESLLERLDLGAPEAPPDRMEVLEALASGEIEVDEAMYRLEDERS